MKQTIPDELLQQCVFLVGPTAVGKTDVTIELARLMPSIEIVSLDSMCIYRGMDIGTAKPSPELQSKLPHHLIDLADPHEDFSVADYVEAARDVCAEILNRGGTPLFAGGTGLYLRGVLRGVFEGPAADWSIRDRLQKQADEAAERGDHFWLMRQLEKVDSEAALRLHPNDQRRLIRALEVYEITGVPLSKQQQQPPRPADERPQNVFWLSPPRDWLHDRIDRRVEQMIQAGLVEEVQALRDRTPPIGHTAAQGLGYKELIAALENSAGGTLTDGELAAAVELIQTRTRQFAKRQHTWFRNLEVCHAVEMTGDESAVSLAETLAARIQTGPV